MALSRTEINSRSDEKRGVKTKGFKLPITFIAEMEQLSKTLGIPQSKLIIQAVEAYKAQLNLNN